MPNFDRPLRIYLGVMCLVSFVLNWCWEMAQMRAYLEMSRATLWDTILPCSRAAGGDMMISLAVYAIGALTTGQIHWGMTGRWNVFAASSILGALFAVTVEWKALSSGKWTYNESMPVVPALEVGLWPLLQMCVLIPAAFWIAWWWSRRR